MLKTLAIGNLGKDAVINEVNGKKVINFTLAHSESWKDSSGEKKEKTIWIDCQYWVDKTTIAQYLTKGKKIYVEGSPDIRVFSRNDGTPGASFVLRVHVIQLLSGSEGNSNTASETPAETTKAETKEKEKVVADDDLPF